MLHFSQNHTYLHRFKSNFLCFIVGNFPFPCDQKAAHCHTMQCWHSGVSIIAIEIILWRYDDLKVLTMSKYTVQSTVSSQPPRQICTHFRLFCSPPPRESRVSGYSWWSQLDEKFPIDLSFITFLLPWNMATSNLFGTRYHVKTYKNARTVKIGIG